MKSAVTIVLLFFCLVDGLHGQIKYQELGEIFADDVKEFIDRGPLEPLEEIEDTSLQHIMLGFRRTDLTSIKRHLSPKLLEELSEMDSILNIYERGYQSIDSIYLFENSGYAVGLEGTLAFAKFSHKKLKDLIIEYQYYYSGSNVNINSVSINYKTFPTELSRIDRLRSLVSDNGLTDKEKYDTYIELLELITPKESNEFNDFYLPQSSDELSMLNGNLSWYALNIGENEVAVSSAQYGLFLNPNNIWINSNLALGLAQTDKFDEAKEIYSKLKDASFRDMLFKDIFISDIEQVESNGNKVEYRDAILEFLEKE